MNTEDCEKFLKCLTFTPEDELDTVRSAKNKFIVPLYGSEIDEHILQYIPSIDLIEKIFTNNNTSVPDELQEKYDYLIHSAKTIVKCFNQSDSKFARIVCEYEIERREEQSHDIKLTITIHSTRILSTYNVFELFELIDDLNKGSKVGHWNDTSAIYIVEIFNKSKEN